ncbi:hypothetical protein GJ744_001578 [Endocarpon pusillum]|uniref:Uncharacterized protein n=1 Tax=Endocarpon pusillum TaxID=364733 RepID=A0A8H7AD53_9EURO|nr:hypothetical protein GJ744_001578 [Endocarpon pusillum]
MSSPFSSVHYLAYQMINTKTATQHQLPSSLGRHYYLLLWPVLKACSLFGDRPIQPSRSPKSASWNQLLQKIVLGFSVDTAPSDIHDLGEVIFMGKGILE